MKTLLRLQSSIGYRVAKEPLVPKLDRAESWQLEEAALRLKTCKI